MHNTGLESHTVILSTHSSCNFAKPLKLHYAIDYNKIYSANDKSLVKFGYTIIYTHIHIKFEPVEFFSFMYYDT